MAPSLRKGFHLAKEDIQPAASYVVYPGKETYSIAEGIKTIGLTSLLKLIAAQAK